MSNTKLYVGNLNYKTTQDEVKNYFSQYGTVVDTIIIEGKGFGFVTMDTEEAANKAKDQSNGQELGGRTLRVADARPSVKRTSPMGGNNRSRGNFSRSPR